MNMKEREAFKEQVKEFCRGIALEDFPMLINLIGHVWVRSIGGNSETHFVCPITSRVLPIRGSKKIVVENIETKTMTSISWYYLSKKAYNKIVKQ